MTASESTPSEGHESTDTENECGTPAAHVRTQAPVHEVRTEVEPIADGLVEVMVRSDDVTAQMLFTPEEAHGLAADLDRVAETVYQRRRDCED